MCTQSGAIKRGFKAILLGKATAITLVAASTPAQADITQVFCLCDMNQTPYRIESFHDATFEPGISFSSDSGIRLTAPRASQGDGTYLSTNSYLDAITISFSAPITSMGLFFGNDDPCCSKGFTANLDIFGTSGLLATLSVDANMNDHMDQFIGFVSDELVTRVTLRYGAGKDVDLFPVIDHVMFNTVVSTAAFQVQWRALATQH